MPFDSLVLSAICRELEREIGSYLDQIYQPNEQTLVLAYSGRGPRRLWLHSVHPRWFRVHRIDSLPSVPDGPPGWCQAVRRSLRGARFVGVSQPQFDRRLILDFERAGDRIQLIHELMGRHANCLVVDASGLVRVAYRVVPLKPGARPVELGQPYQPPPAVGVDLTALSPADLEAVAASSERLIGWSPFADSQHPGVQRSEAVVAKLTAARKGTFEPGFIQGDQGPMEFWAFPIVGAGDRWVSTPTMSRACATYYAAAESGDVDHQRRARLRSALERVLRTADVQLREARAALDSQATDQLRRQGELLAANLGNVTPGSRSVTVPDWYSEDGGQLEIPLDPSLSARENLDRIFHREKRFRASQDAAQRRLPEIQGRQAAAKALAERLDQLAGAELEAAEQEARATGWLRTPNSDRPSSTPTESPYPSGVRIHRRDLGNWVILWGDNATSNDYLTTKIARPNDLWLHARAVKGCHVVVKGVSDLGTLPHAILMAAASIAAAKSESKHASVIPVDYTFRRYVRKPRGSTPGTVTYEREKTLDVAPDQDLLGATPSRQ